MDRNVEKGNMFSVVWFKYVLSSRIVCLLWYSKGMNPHLERYSLFRGWDYVATVWCLLATQCHWKNFHQKSNCRRRGCVMLLPQATAMIDKPMRYDALLLYIYMHIHTYNKYYVYKTVYDFKRKQHRTPNHAAAAERLFFFPGFMVMVRKTWTLLHLWAETVPPMPLFVEPIVAFSVRPAWDAAHGWPLGLGLIPAVCGLRARFLICFI